MKLAVAIVLSLAFTSVLFAPTASARPQCIEVYPWSELCQGDVGGFLCAMNACPTVASPTGGPHVDCIQAIPWSYLCSGNLQAFVEYYTGPLL